MTLFLLLLVFIAIAVALAWFLIAHDHGEHEPIGALWMAAGFGVVGAVMAALLEHSFVNTNNLKPTAPLTALAVAAASVGIIEELCKFVPLAIFLYRKRYFNEHTDGVIYFALAGLGFGLPENILYTLQFGTGTGVGRIILTPFFHAATTALVGYFLIRCKLSKIALWTLAFPLLGMITLHAFYDFGLSSGRPVFAIAAVAVTLTISAALFELYVRSNELDQDQGLSVVGNNAFCRTCGTANPHHQLFCTACGKNA